MCWNHHVQTQGAGSEGVARYNYQQQSHVSPRKSPTKRLSWLGSAGSSWRRGSSSSGCVPGRSDRGRRPSRKGSSSYTQEEDEYLSSRYIDDSAGTCPLLGLFLELGFGRDDAQYYASDLQRRSIETPHELCRYQRHALQHELGFKSHHADSLAVHFSKLRV